MYNLLIDGDNHCKIFISEKSKYCIKNDNESMDIEIWNEFKDIRKSYKINVKDMSDKYYNIDYEPNNIKHCTVLLIDDDDDSKIFISEKKLYNIEARHNVYNNYDNYINGDHDDDDYYELFYIPLNNFEHLVSSKNNITNLIKNNNNYRHKITLLVDNINIFICKNTY